MADAMISRDLVASCWTWAGNAKPARGDERSPIDFAERVAAVAATGWHGVGIVHADVVAVRDSIGLPTARRMLADAGITHVELEFISNWWQTGERRRASDAVRRDLFDAAAELGAATIKVGGELDDFVNGPRVEAAHFASEFDALATHAGSLGLRVALEPMPMSNIRTIEQGAALIADVENPHAGLVVDVWHTARGGTDYHDLPEFLSIESVFVVELDDAARDVVGSLWEDTLDRRLLPGDGDFRVAEFVSTLHGLGWRGPWGVEILSEDHRQRPLLSALADTHDKTMSTIDAAEALSTA